MLSNILISTDASEASDHIIDCVKDLRRVGSRKAVLTHVINVRDAGGLYVSLKRMTVPKLEEQQRRLAAAGFETTLEIPLGYPDYEINRLARENESSLIVVGSHGESLVKDMLLGSTAHSVLMSARTGVLLIRVEITETAGGTCCRIACSDFFRHILHPTDFSATAEHAFEHLEHIVRETHCAVTLLHVQDKVKLEPHLIQLLDDFNRIDTERLERMKARLLKAGASEVDIQVSLGSPTALILEQARCDKYSLILMGTQGRGALWEIVMGSVSHNIARHAPLPVLFVPARSK